MLDVNRTVRTKPLKGCPRKVGFTQRALKQSDKLRTVNVNRQWCVGLTDSVQEPLASDIDVQLVRADIVKNLVHARVVSLLEKRNRVSPIPTRFGVYARIINPIIDAYNVRRGLQ